jgi:hypothetical protein
MRVKQDSPRSVASQYIFPYNRAKYSSEDNAYGIRADFAASFFRHTALDTGDNAAAGPGKEKKGIGEEKDTVGYSNSFYYFFGLAGISNMPPAGFYRY